MEQDDTQDQTPAETPEEAPEAAVNPFEALGLSAPLLRAIADVGYEAPTPIQAKTIPPLLAGRDLFGQAQTGTGKTAAFAIPLLQRLELARFEVQGLVLTPTRELALQVAEAIHTYSRHLGRVGVLPVYGGQSIGLQVKRLERGVHIVVGTPGRIMDHLRRGTLSLEKLRTVVLDEADEMLRMGFLEDVEWILSQAPDAASGRQTALFSATLPPEVRRISRRHLHDPVSIEIEHRAVTVPGIEQRYLNISEDQKIEALTRLLETETSEAVLIFRRTKNGAADLAEKLEGRGYSAEPLHGDMGQPQRETVLRRLRAGQVDIVVATDVAARGLDVEHISHVINYDMPYDAESYVHRIGRTGRAGRTGVAVLFVTPRERRMMADIERYTKQPIQPMRMPSRADVAARRIAMFKESLKRTLEQGDLDLYLTLVEDLAKEGGYDMAEVAAAAARLARGDQPLVEVEIEPERQSMPATDGGMVRLFLAAGRMANVRASDIVGAIANEAGVPGRAIGAIDIYDRFTFVELPAEYKDQVLERMARAKIRGRPVNIRVADREPGEKDDRGPRPERRAPEGPGRERPRGAGPGGPPRGDGGWNRPTRKR